MANADAAVMSTARVAAAAVTSTARVVAAAVTSTARVVAAAVTSMSTHIIMRAADAVVALTNDSHKASAGRLNLSFPPVFFTFFTTASISN